MSEDFKRTGDTFITHDLKRCYAVWSFNPKTGSLKLYRSDYRGRPVGPGPFHRKCEPENVWMFVDGPTRDAIRGARRGIVDAE